MRLLVLVSLAVLGLAACAHETDAVVVTRPPSEPAPVVEVAPSEPTPPITTPPSPSPPPETAPRPRRDCPAIACGGCPGGYAPSRDGCPSCECLHGPSVMPGPPSRGPSPSP